MSRYWNDDRERRGGCRDRDGTNGEMPVQRKPAPGKTTQEDLEGSGLSNAMADSSGLSPSIGADAEPVSGGAWEANSDLMQAFGLGEHDGQASPPKDSDPHATGFPGRGKHGNTAAGSKQWPHEVIGDAISRTPERTTAKRERDYHSAAAIKVDENHYRFYGFDVDSAQPRAEFVAMLNEIATTYRPDLDVTIVVTGHTSASGTEMGNIGLANQRAAAIATELRLRGVVQKHYIVTGVGETDPIADENNGPSAMARNRRVELSIIPGEKKPDPEQQAPPAAAYSPNPCGVMTKGQAILELNMTLAEIELWTLQQGKAHGGGLPRLGFDEGVIRPDKGDWYAACHSNHVPDAWCEYLYDSLYFPADGNMLRHINDKKAEASRLKSLIDSDQCPPGNAEPLPKAITRPPKDPMPGDVDPKGRRY